MRFYRLAIPFIFTIYTRVVHTSTDTYYRILGVGENASLAEIKSAYRKQALLLHPDRNKAPSAHQDFILLTEAYEYFSGVKSGKINPSSNNWEAKAREEARQRAAEHARMEHEEFINSDYFKTSEAAEVVLNHFLFLFVLVGMFGAPVVGYLLIGMHGLWAGLFIMVGTSPGWLSVLFEDRPKLGLALLGNAMIYLSRNLTVMTIVFSIINFILLLRIDIITAVPFNLLPLVFIIPCILLWLGSRFLKPELRIYFSPKAIVCIAPTMVSLFFLLNFLFAGNYKTETYAYQPKMEWYSFRGGGGRYEATSMINLEGNKYEAYKGFRMFYDYDAVKASRSITYTFAEGLFGLRVIKSFRFN